VELSECLEPESATGSSVYGEQAGLSGQVPRHHASRPQQLPVTLFPSPAFLIPLESRYVRALRLSEKSQAEASVPLSPFQLLV
jgi:hypothetical protein